MESYEKSTAGKPDLTSEKPGTFSHAPFDKTITCAETVRDLDERIARLNQRVDKIQNLKVGATFTKANMTILADEDGPVQLRLIYRRGYGAWF